jgi:hypothetical protein
MFITTTKKLLLEFKLDIPLFLEKKTKNVVFTFQKFMNKIIDVANDQCQI